MKCVKIDGVKKLVPTTMEDPVLKEGCVLIKVESTGICGSDIHYWDSGEPKGLVMGHEVAGVVIDPGDREDLKKGDRVVGLPISPCGKCEACKTGNPQYCPDTWTHALGLSMDFPGGYSECINMRSDMVRKMPDSMSFDEGAMVEPTAVSLHASVLADIKVGDKVLVVGGGIIGLMAIEFAKMEGASYIAIAETNEKRGKKATTVGKATEFFDAKDEKLIEKLKSVTNGGFDVVIECCGNTPAVSEAIMACKPGGKVVLVGVANGPINVPLVMSVMGEQTLQGAIAYTEHDFDTAIDLIASKSVNVKKYIDDIIGLDGVNDAFIRLTNGHDDAVKIIIHPNS